MNSAAKKPAGLPFHQGPRAHSRRVRKLVREEAELASSVETALAGEHVDERSFARLLRARCSATRQGITLIFNWMSQLDRRISQLESHVSGLANRAANQEDTMRMMCSMLEELDDPYGFGQSLDERVLGEAAHGPADEQD